MAKGQIRRSIEAHVTAAALKLWIPCAERSSLRREVITLAVAVDLEAKGHGAIFIQQERGIICMGSR